MTLPDLIERQDAAYSGPSGTWAERWLPWVCQHREVRCTHGDEILHRNYRRRVCMVCGRALRGDLPEICFFTARPHGAAVEHAAPPPPPAADEPGQVYAEAFRVQDVFGWQCHACDTEHPRMPDAESAIAAAAEHNLTTHPLMARLFDKYVGQELTRLYPAEAQALRHRVARAHAEGSLPVCGPDGWVRRGIFYDGVTYRCRGTVDYEGVLVYCCNPIHQQHPQGTAAPATARRALTLVQADGELRP